MANLFNSARARWAALGLFAAFPASAVAGGLALPPFLGCAGAAAATWSGIKKAVSFQIPALSFLLLFAAWAAVSALWSPYANHGQAVRLLATLLPGMAFAGAATQPNAARWFRAAALAAFVITTALLAVEARADMMLNRMAMPDTPDWMVARNPGRGASILVVMGWGVAAGLWSQPGLQAKAAALAVLAAAALLSIEFQQLANAAAFAVGLAAFLLTLIAPRFGLWLVGGSLAFWQIVAPFAWLKLFAGRHFIDEAPFPIAVRGEIWTYASQHILEKPWLGHGLDATRMFSERTTLRGEPVDLMPLHPHSASLHVWFECGAVGAGLAALALLFGTQAIAKSVGDNRLASGAICATMASFGLLANSTYGAWQEWWWALACIAAASLGAVATKMRAH